MPVEGSIVIQVHRESNGIGEGLAKKELEKPWLAYLDKLPEGLREEIKRFERKEPTISMSLID